MRVSRRRVLILLALLLLIVESDARLIADDARVHKDIEFASIDGHSLTLDVYLPAAANPPLVVWIHGGGWQAGSKESCPVVWLTEHGYAVASINYRLTDTAIFPAQIHDCKAAVRWLRAHADQFGFQTERMAVAGSSAGGHLAALMGTSGGVQELEGTVGGHLDQSSRVDAVVDFYGATDFVLRSKTQPQRANAKGSVVYRLLGGGADQNVALARLASPAFHVTADDPPFLVFHGDEDKTVLLDQTQRIQDVYTAAKLPITVHVLQGSGHGGNEFYNGPQRQLVIEFLDRHLTPDTFVCWQTGVTVRPVAPELNSHSIHAYYNVCPESPDGKDVLYYTSTTPEGETGDLRIRERASGQETIIASGIVTEDAHRAACQQWVNGGRTIVYHDCHDGRWRVVAVDVATLQHTVLAEDRQLGFGAVHHSWAPVYGCHWNPGQHRDLELIDVETGEITKPVTIKQVVEECGDWVQTTFGTQDISIFFPWLSPDARKVFFKLARPSGGRDFRSKQASFRAGLVVYDLAEGRFVRLFERWGHPSWGPDSRAVFEKDKSLRQVESGRSERFAPSSPANHPSLSPDATVFVTDADVSRRDFGHPGDWAIVVGDMSADRFTVVAQFNNTRGATSWRPSHPHPSFSADGQRIYFNVSDGQWTRLFVAETAATTVSSTQELMTR